MARQIRFAISLTMLGLACVSGSFLWPRLITKDMVWSEEQAREKTQASAHLHEMTHVAAHSTIDPKMSEAEKARVSQELQAAQKRFDDSRAALDRARRLRDTGAIILRWVGSFLMIVGVVWYMAVRGSPARR